MRRDVVDPFEGINLPSLEKSIYTPRAAFSAFLSLLTGGMTLPATLPLISVLAMLIWLVLIVLVFNLIGQAISRRAIK